MRLNKLVLLHKIPRNDCYPKFKFIYHRFKYFKNEADASTFIKEIKTLVDNKFDNKKDTLASQTDLSNIELRISDLKIDMKEQKSEIIKWMFIFWIGQIGATIALIYFRK